MSWDLGGDGPRFGCSPGLFEKRWSKELSAHFRFLSRTEKTPKENLHKEFRRDPGRGVKEGA